VHLLALEQVHSLDTRYVRFRVVSITDIHKVVVDWIAGIRAVVPHIDLRMIGGSISISSVSMQDQDPYERGITSRSD